MYAMLAEHIYYPMADLLYGSSIIKYYHWLQKTQWWSPDRLREVQNIKLHSLVNHAVNNVSYYHNMFSESGLNINDIQNVEDLSKLPILTKTIIRKYPDNIVADGIHKYHPIKNSTGGSTGEPLQYYITKDEASMTWAGVFRAWNWADYKIGDKRIAFGGSSLVPNKKPSKFQLLRQKLERNLPLSAVSMNDAKYEQYLYTIRKYNPRFLKGYPSSIYMLAEYCREHNVKDIKFQAVFSTAEVLLPNYRDLIERQFKCKIFDNYGSYDGGGQANECEQHKGLHISIEKVIMEIVDDKGKTVSPGQPGRILVTDLHNYAMPFIRYDVGDIGIIDNKPCSCGRGLPLLKSIEGRTTDIIKLSNGVVIAGPAVTVIFKDCHAKQYQLVQIAKDELLVKVVQGSGYSEQDTEHFMNILSHHAGKETKIKLEFCEKIETGVNSKHRFVISRI